MDLGNVVRLLGAIVAAVLLALFVRKTIQAVRGDPAFWEGEIRRFERADRREMPPAGAILFTGSSSIRFWHSLDADMAPLEVINRGFGGAQIHQVTHYFDRIVLPYEPRAVVFYAGENDLSGTKMGPKRSAEDILEAFKEFCARVYAHFPAIPIYFISIKPPKLRLRFWPEMQRANDLIRALCASDDRLHYIDVASAMLDEQSQPRTDLFRWDGIHLNEKGYAIWTAVVRPILLQELGEKRGYP